jgi:hypothetical protein
MLKSKSWGGKRLIEPVADDERLELSEDIDGEGLGSLQLRVSCNGKICGRILHALGAAAALPKKSCKERDILDDEPL